MASKCQFQGAELHKIIKKLTGNIEPIGESYHDEKALNNLKAYTDLFLLMFDDIENILFDTRQEASVQDCVEIAKKTIDIISESSYLRRS